MDARLYAVRHIFNISTTYFPTSDYSMIKHYSDLVCTIQDPAGLACSLYSRGIICQSVRDEVQQRGDLTTKKKNEVLINAVEARVTTDPSTFQVFMEVLKEEPSLSIILKRMSGLGECVHNVDCTDTCMYRIYNHVTFIQIGV